MLIVGKRGKNEDKFKTFPGKIRHSMSRYQVGQLKDQLNQIYAKDEIKKHLEIKEKAMVNDKFKQELSMKLKVKVEDAKPKVGQFDLNDNKKPLKFEGSPKRALSPRVCYSLEDQTKKNQEDILIVLADQDKPKEEVKVMVDNWVEGQEKGKKGQRMSRSRNKKSSTSSKSSESLSSTGTVVQKSVGQIKKSFENLKSPEVVRKFIKSPSPVRVFAKSPSPVRKFAKSPSPVRTYAKSPSPLLHGNVKELRKSFEQIPQMDEEMRFPQSRSLSAENRKRISSSQKRISFSNPDLSDTECRRKSSPDPHKYARSYLALVRAGEVIAKRSKFEAISPDQLYHRRLPEIDRDYIEQHLTDLSRPVLKPKEIGNIELTLKRLHKKPEQIRDKSPPKAGTNSEYVY